MTAGEPAARALRPTWGEVDLDAVAHNLARVRETIRPGVTAAVSLKADAYGHGALAIAGELDRLEVPLVMTESLPHAVAMRGRGCRFEIVLLGSALPDALPACVEAGVRPTIHTAAGAEAVSEHARGPAAVFVKVDSGLGRLGVPVELAAEFIKWAARLPNVVVEGIYTHLPFWDAAGETWAAERLERFADVLEEVARAGIEVRTIQAISSPGVLMGLDHPRLTAVCVGSLLYGLPVPAAPPGAMDGLRRALVAVRTRLIQVTRHPAERRAGSGGARSYAAGSTTGVVPIGLGDGYGPVQAGQELEMLVRGRRVRVVATTMAQTVLDLGPVESADVGEEVTVLGRDGADEIRPEEIAMKLGLAPAGVALRFNRRIPYDHVRRGALEPSVRGEVVAY